MSYQYFYDETPIPFTRPSEEKPWREMALNHLKYSVGNAVADFLMTTKAPATVIFVVSEVPMKELPHDDRWTGEYLRVSGHVLGWPATDEENRKFDRVARDRVHHA